MKRKKILKLITLILFLALLVYEGYNALSYFTKGNLVISTKTSQSCYSGANIEALVGVEKRNGKLVDSKVKIQLCDSEGKKIKNAKESQKIEKGENKAFSIKVPENMETGKYILKVTANSGFSKDTAEVPISLIKNQMSNITISLDKGIYKPGDEINYRALVITNQEYKPLAQDVNIEIYDGNNNKVYSESTKTSEYGIVSGKFNLADEVNSGTYKISVKTDAQEVNKNFTVNPYIIPKFESAISTDKENYIVGENAQITISSKYFFGEPVVGASIKGTINEEEVSGLSDANGNFVTTYNVTKEGKLNLQFNVTDTSNYAVEINKSLNCGTDIFEIEILPEYGKIAQGIDNDIYVITKTANGDPVKTYSNIMIAGKPKQVISDEKGIGVFTLTASDTYDLKKSEKQKINVTAQDMNSNTVNKSIDVDVAINGTNFIKTDKTKYEEGDDIEVSLESPIERNTNTIYVFKNKELLKICSSDSTDFEFNLDDVTGLIDIYVENGKRMDYNKKTIFIKPSKALSINVETDKEQYRPGDTLNVKFDTQNAGKQSTDAALLVSILDEAVLNLADNDLSIDNIKLALQDIELTPGVTAADLYADVLDDSSELTLKSVLLKQDGKNMRINSSSYINYDKGDYFEKAIITGIIIVAIIVLYYFIKNEKLRKALVPIIDMLGIFVIIYIYTAEMLYDYIDITGMIPLICAVLSTILYNLFLYKEKDYIFKLIKEIIVIPGIITFIITIIIRIVANIADIYFEELFIIPLFLALLLLAEYANLKRKVNDKKNLTKFEKKLKKVTEILMKSFVFWISVMIVSSILDEIAFLVVLALYVILTKWVFGNPENKIKDGKIIINITRMEIVGMVAGILLIVLLIFMVYQEYIKPAYWKRPQYIGREDSTSHSWGTDSIVTEYNSSSNSESIFGDIDYNSATTESHDRNLFDGFGIFGTFSANVGEDSQSNQAEIDTTIQSESDTNISKDIKTDEKVRNVFLESLAFIPELITENGKAETELKISDNITTWNIQTVGNTKDGEIGYGSASFKVFKEFFVDFSLPENSVVTDKVEIPVTIYNYTTNDMSINLDVKANEWSKIGEYAKTVNVPAGSTNMVYVPLEIIKSGNNTLRVEAKSGELSDIIEKTFKVDINGLKKEELVSSGIIEKNYSQDMVFNENAIEGTKKVKVKLYPSPISQAIEGMESILSLPTGCFEQTSSSLYPDILVLEYLENNKLDKPELREKALGYIEKGYQKLLTYEVKNEKGGYSLYGNSPAETVITAFGLMEMNELSKVYNVDENVILNMKDYLFKNQKSDGSFEFKSTYIGGAENDDKYAMNAYIIWALSEVCPDDSRLEKSVNYLERKLDKITDNYTLALIANVFANTDNENAKDVIKELSDEITVSDNKAYISSDRYDYYGSTGRYQQIQSTALYSMALSKLNESPKTNAQLVDYLISSRYSGGTWGTTQSTILALKAINDYSTNSDISNQKLIVNINGEEKSIEVDENALDFYELEFDNIQKENKIKIEAQKGKIIYEVIKNYYMDYSEELNHITPKILVEQTINQTVKVNDTINQNVHVVNNSDETIANGLVQINIPQGCSVNEDSLMLLKHKGLIEKYEYNYGKINLYLRNFEKKEDLKLDITYKALYPETVTSCAIRAYDYYNPEVDGICKPVQITVNK